MTAEKIDPAVVLLNDWADAACVRFVSRSYGPRTTDTVNQDDLLQLVRAAMAQADAERAALFKTARGNRADAERYRLIAESSQGTIRLDGGPGGTRWAAPQYIHWTGNGLDAAIDAAFPD